MNKKVTFSIDEELLQKIDDECRATYMTRSGYFTFLARQHLFATQMSDAMVKLVDVVQEIASKGNVSPEDMKRLNEIQTLANLIKSRK